jgi:hypothetical protein
MRIREGVLSQIHRHPVPGLKCYDRGIQKVVFALPAFLKEYF